MPRVRATVCFFAERKRKAPRKTRGLLKQALRQANGLLSAQALLQALCTKKTIKEFFGEDEENIIAYLSEDSIYLSSYSRGQEQMEKILKREDLL